MGNRRWLRGAIACALLAACKDGIGPEAPKLGGLDLAPPQPEFEVGDSVRLSVTAVDEEGAPLDAELLQVAWSTSDEAVVRVRPDGWLFARGVGGAYVYVAAGEVRDSVRVEVQPARVWTVTVEPGAVTLDAGALRQLTVLLESDTGDRLEGRAVSWSSSDVTVARVDSLGTVTARSAGMAEIRAESEGRTGRATVTVQTLALSGLQLEPLVPGVFTPVQVTAPAGDDRLFVVGIRGEVVVMENDERVPAPFLDLRSRVHQEGESGLFSIAFHPDYAANGYFYVNYADASGTIHIERYRVSAERNVADPASRKPILTIEHPNTRAHFGGMMEFGPDGKLYISTGDGGPGHSASAQARGSLLGKILRIDVDAGDPYAVPADNPFVGMAGARGEVWALGLRNPWRMSFDHATGLLYIADVGENHWEEINVVPGGRGGANFGWNAGEGDHCFPIGSECSLGGFVAPALEYPHEANAGEEGGISGCAAIGGYVYRGQGIPALSGHYFYGDLCQGWVRSFRYDEGRVVDQRGWNFPNFSFLVGFGRDARGELYVLPYSGIVHRIVP